MNPIVRAVLATIGGFAAGQAVLIGTESLLPAVLSLPPAPSMEGGHEAEWRAYVAAMPASAHIGLLVCYALAAFVAGYVAAWIAKRDMARWPVVIIALLFGAAGIFNFISLGHPMWVVVAGSILLFGMPFVGAAAKKS